MKPFQRLAGYWIAPRQANPEILAAAQAAVAGLKPAVAVTGASRGIGFALAEHFAKEGHDVALIARRPDALQAGLLRRQPL